ncbi:MAG: phosphate signaling complex protein PhoU [Oceanospirillaceae bacterium]|nr:phosphate signaling complex protein PhoU [Oceanospirillaceae bacterium]
MTNKDSNTEGFTSHISKQFNDELEQVRTELLAMGGIVERQVHQSVEALLNGDVQLAEEALAIDLQTNAMELVIDERCTSIIARRQPAASDLRLVVSISKAVVDLERMGDEASRICRQTIEIAAQGGSKHGFQEVRHIANLVRSMVKEVLTAFARGDVEQAFKVAKSDRAVDQEYRSAMRTLVSLMMEDPRSISSCLNVIWVLRSLERIGDHSRNMAEHIIYIVSGQNVRHQSLTEMKAAVDKSI